MAIDTVHVKLCSALPELRWQNAHMIKTTDMISSRLGIKSFLWNVRNEVKGDFQLIWGQIATCFVSVLLLLTCGFALRLNTRACWPLELENLERTRSFWFYQMARTYRVHMAYQTCTNLTAVKTMNVENKLILLTEWLCLTHIWSFSKWAV